MVNNQDFENLIKKDRDLHQTRSWRGNFLGYLEKVADDFDLDMDVVRWAQSYELSQRARAAA